MSARVYYMKTVNGFKDVSIMSPQDEQWRRTSLRCLYTAIFLFFKVQRMQSKHQQTKSEHSRQITAFSVGITKLNQRIIKKDDIEFLTEFPCFLGHPVPHSLAHD